MFGKRRPVKVLNVGACVVLGLFVLNNLLRGGVHVFAADGGAATAAGLDLGSSGGVVVSLFAAIGAMQMVVGGFELYVLAWRRDLVTIALGVQAALSVTGVLVLQVWKPLPVPQTIATVSLLLAVLAVAGWIAAMTTARRVRVGSGLIKAIGMGERA